MMTTEQLTEMVKARIGDRPFEVSITPNYWGTRLEVFHKGHPNCMYQFSVMDGYMPGLDHLDAIMEAMKARATKIHHRVCCSFAERKFCVCEISYTCKVHGGGCIGSHD